MISGETPLILLSSVAPSIALIIEYLDKSYKIPKQWQERLWYISFFSFIALTGGILTGIISIYEGYGQSVLWIYPFAVAMFQLLFYRTEDENFLKVFSYSLLFGYVLTEIHEVPNFIYNYMGRKAFHPLHPLTNMQLVFSFGYLLHAMKYKRSVESIAGILTTILMSFAYFHLFYAPENAIIIRLIQFSILLYTLWKWGEVK